MRWKYSDIGNPEERRDRAATIEAIDRWWHEFSRKTADLNALFSRKTDWDLPAWMQEHLNAISPKLCWEFGPGLPVGHRLVITPESHRALRPLVQTILDRAPEIAGWSFHAYRLPENFKQTISTVQSRTKGDVSSTRFLASLADHNRIDLKLLWPGRSYQEGNAAKAAFVAIETLLGEEVLDKWIGCIDVEADKWFSKSKPLDQLKPAVDQLIGQIHDKLFSKPCFQVEDAKWTMWKLKPKTRKDYAGQHDLFVGKSMLPGMWQAAHGSCIFYSSSFSKCGETFCYVKIDGSQGLDQEKFKDKGDIEDALEEALKGLSAGGVIGGGTGLRYSYIDLALKDVERGIEAIRSVLRQGNIARRTWVLFFDAELSKEWIGIWDDTPPPPLDDEVIKQEGRT